MLVEFTDLGPDDPRVLRWRDAWFAAMAEAGYPYARIVGPYQNGWEAWPDGTWCAHTHDDPERERGWNAGMRAWVFVETLRPWWVEQTPLVGMIMAGECDLPTL